MTLILASDRVKLRTPAALVERPGHPPGGSAIPAGTIGAVVSAPYQDGAALVRWRGPYPPSYVNLRELERARFADLLPGALRLAGGWLGRRAYIAAGVAAAALISGGIGAFIQHSIAAAPHCSH